MHDILVLDIETGGLGEEEVVRDFEATWSPSPSTKPENVEACKSKALAKWKDKAALTYSAPVVSVAIYHPNTGVIVLVASPEQVAVDGIKVICCGNERGVLVGLSQLLDQLADNETEIVGHNVKGFDLCKLRVSYARYDLAPPEFLRPGQPVFDSMIYWERYCRFGLDNKAMHSVEGLAKILGVDCHKKLVDGSMIPELAAAGEWSKIAQYNALDVLVEYQIFRRLRGYTPPPQLVDMVSAQFQAL